MDKATIIAWVEARLAERSTWIGAISLLSALGVALDPTQAAMIASIGAAIAGALLVYSKDHNVAEAVETAIAAVAEAQAAAKVAAPVTAPAPAPEAEAEKK